MNRKTTISEARKIAESMGFSYRASDESNESGSWMTLTYPNTNTYVVYVDLSKEIDILQTLALELVRCGRIQERQSQIKRMSPFNYD